MLDYSQSVSWSFLSLESIRRGRRRQKQDDDFYLILSHHVCQLSPFLLFFLVLLQISVSLLGNLEVCSHRVKANAKRKRFQKDINIFIFTNHVRSTREAFKVMFSQVCAILFTGDGWGWGGGYSLTKPSQGGAVTRPDLARGRGVSSPDPSGRRSPYPSPPS